MAMSCPRRFALLLWARRYDARIIADDYLLSEVQLKERAAAALASLYQDEWVLHIGDFSKNIGPALLAVLVIPLEKWRLIRRHHGVSTARGRGVHAGRCDGTTVSGARCHDAS